MYSPLRKREKKSWDCHEKWMCVSFSSIHKQHAILTMFWKFLFVSVKAVESEKMTFASEDNLELVDISEAVRTPERFEFPFPPYDIQHQFMIALFNALNKGQLGIFESPTGTGKSLSLICGALTWFIEYNKQRKLALEMLVKDDKTNEVISLLQLLPIYVKNFYLFIFVGLIINKFLSYRTYSSTLIWIFTKRISEFLYVPNPYFT